MVNKQKKIKYEEKNLQFSLSFKNLELAKGNEKKLSLIAENVKSEERRNFER